MKKLQLKHKEIIEFCLANSDNSIINKYSKYFKEGYKGYGIDTKIFESQKSIWLNLWSNDMTLDDYLDLGDILMSTGLLEEASFATFFIASKKDEFSIETFDRIGKWLDKDIKNWATTDILCMFVLCHFLIDKIISFEKLKEWTTSESEWKRRAVPVTLVVLIKNELKLIDAINLIEPLMLDDSEYVQKGIGTLLRGLWKEYPAEIENFLMNWKDKCGRLIVQYSTEKMDKEYRKKFRKIK